MRNYARRKLPKAGNNGFPVECAICRKEAMANDESRDCQNSEGSISSFALTLWRRLVAREIKWRSAV
jgi:hypothetical protein